MTPEERARMILEGYFAVVLEPTPTISMAELRGMLAGAIRAAIREEREACAELAGTIVKSQGWESGEQAWSLSDLNAANYTADLIAGEIRKRG